MERSDKYSATYNSYNKELASMHKQNIAIEKIMNADSIANEFRYDINDTTKKHVLYKQPLAWTCDGSWIAPLTERAILANQKN